MDRISAMNAFARVVEAGSFTKAANTLDIPNATVTRLIQYLEQDLRVRLLHRTTRALTLTPEGAIYYERVVRLLADLEDIESSTKGAQRRPAGKVRVETGTALGCMVIVPSLQRFCREFPNVEVELGLGNRRSDLVAEGVDCAIRAGDLSDQSIIARQIGAFHGVTCASPGFLRMHGAPKGLEGLRSMPTVGMMSARTGRPLSFRFLDGTAESSLDLNHKLVVNDTNCYLHAGLAGLGIIQAPNFVVRDALKTGQLVAVLDGWESPTVPVHVLYAPNRYLSAKVRVFIDWVIALFDQHDCLRRNPARPGGATCLDAKDQPTPTSNRPLGSAVL